MSQTAQMPETTHIPMTFRPRGGKTVIVLPDGSRGVVRREATIDNTMIKVIARGFRWQRLLYDGTYATIEDLAAAEKINPSYVSRILRLAYLSPTVVQASLWVSTIFQSFNHRLKILHYAGVFYHQSGQDHAIQRC